MVAAERRYGVQPPQEEAKGPKKGVKDAKKGAKDGKNGKKGAKKKELAAEDDPEEAEAVPLIPHEALTNSSYREVLAEPLPEFPNEEKNIPNFKPPAAWLEGALPPAGAWGGPWA